MPSHRTRLVEITGVRQRYVVGNAQVTSGCARVYRDVPDTMTSHLPMFQLGGRPNRLGREMVETIGDAGDSLTRQRACVVCDLLNWKGAQYHAIDAPIMPEVPRANTYLTTVLIAEHVAARINGETR